MTTAREYSAEDKKLFNEIKEGRTFDRDETLPPLYDKSLKNLLWMQGDSEYSGALGYMPWIQKAPDLKEKVLVAQIDQNRRDAQNERECCILRPDRLASYTRQDHEN